MQEEIIIIKNQMQQALNRIHNIPCDKGHDKLNQDCSRCKELIQFGSYIRLAIRKGRRMLQPDLEPLNLNRWVFDTEIQAERLAKQQAKALEM